MFWMLSVFGPLLLIGLFVAREQERINRAVDETPPSAPQNGAS